MLAKQQHYVPRFLLRNFTSGKNPFIWVFDKHKDITFRTNIQNIAAEKGFYNSDKPDSTLTLEPGLAHLEDKTSSIVYKLIKSKRLRDLSEESRLTLACFLAVQFVRTKEHRLIIDAIQDSVKLHLEKMGSTPMPEEQSSKMQSFRSVAGASDFVPQLINKTWVLFEAKRANPLYISDNPMTLHNRRDHGFYGNLGLAVPGIEIYFPISTTMCLGLMCPTIGQEFIKAHENFQVLDRLGAKIPENFLKDASGAREFCRGVVNGTSNLLGEENVIMLNSLQVTFSSRFVYCKADRFDLVRTMIHDNPKFRNGLKPLTS